MNIDDQTSVRDFYGSATDHIKNMDKAVSAVRQFGIASRAQADNVRERGLELACKSEREAFAA